MNPSSDSDKSELLVKALTTNRKEVFSRFGRKPSFAWDEVAIRMTLKALAYFTIVVTVAIVLVLSVDAVNFFTKVNIFDFLFGTHWEPFGGEKKLGVLPLLSGTMMIAVGSSLIAIPLGLGTAIFLTQYAPKRWQNFLGSTLEILGGIPTVVYGYFAISTITPLLKMVFPDVEVFNALSASIVVGIGTMPMVSSLSAEALRVVPLQIRNAAYAVGMSKFHVVTRVMVPAALSGIISSFLLAFARAVGETMAVTLAGGATPNMSWNYLHSIQTMTAFIVQISLGDTPAGSLEYYTIYAIGLTLFFLTLFFNMVAYRLVRRFREVYQ